MLPTFLLLLGSSVLICQAQVLETPPSIISSFQQTYYVASRSKVEFQVQCQAKGNPAPDITWTVEGTQIEDQYYRRLYPNGTLFITVSNDKFEPYGKYQCFAKNNKGMAMSNEFNIKRPNLEGFLTPEVILNLPRVDEYSYVSMKCNDRPNCFPESACTTEWKIGTGADLTVKTNERIALDAVGTIHFLYVESADQLPSSSFYGCGLWNSVLSLLTKGSLTTLTVNKVANPQIQKMVARYSKDATGLLGKSAELQCIFSGYPLPIVRWFDKSDNQINAGSKYDLTNNNRVLKVKNLDSSDEMDYKCRGLQIDDTGETLWTNTLIVFLNVTAPPQATTDQMKNVVAPIGSEVKYSCYTTSLKEENAPVGPVWYYNGKEITEATIDFEQRYKKENDSTVLVIGNVQKAYMGSFQCMSYNSEGTFMRDATLVVIDPIKIVASPPKTLMMMPEELDFFYVNATSDPFTLKYNWTFINQDEEVYHNHQDIETNFPPELRLSADRQNLTMDGSGLEGGEIYKLVGTYTVNVYHQYETVTIVMQVTTDASITPVPVVSSAGGFDPIIIAIILGVIVLFVVIFLIACLLYRNRGGTYPLDKKELAAGHNPEKELANAGFHDLSRADGFDDEKPTSDRMSLNDSEKDYDSDDDLDQEYGGDLDTSKFNEDGSFIGQYHDSKRAHVNQSVV